MSPAATTSSKHAAAAVASSLAVAGVGADRPGSTRRGRRLAVVGRPSARCRRWTGPASSRRVVARAARSRRASGWRSRRPRRRRRSSRATSAICSWSCSISSRDRARTTARTCSDPVAIGLKYQRAVDLLGDEPGVDVVVERGLERLQQVLDRLRVVEHLVELRHAVGDLAAVHVSSPPLDVTIQHPSRSSMLTDSPSALTSNVMAATVTERVSPLPVTSYVPVGDRHRRRRPRRATPGPRRRTAARSAAAPRTRSG